MIRLRVLRIVPVVVVAASACGPARANSHFTESDDRDVVYCDYTTLAGRYTAAASQYQAAGSCAAFHTPDTGNNTAGRQQSQFPDPTHAPQLWQANWTSQGAYDAKTHQATETITLPAPTIDRPAAAGQPYGRFVTTMLCMDDPWLGPTSCSAPKTSVAGNLGPLLVPVMQQRVLPFTAPAHAKDLQALLDQRKKATAMLQASASTPVSASPLVATRPTVVAPGDGSSNRLGAPLAFRVAPPPLKVATYRVEVQRKDAHGNWVAWQTAALAGAAAQSAAGAALWGSANAASPQGGALGSYRLRASADGGPASDWRAFEVAGPAALTATTSNGTMANAGVWQPSSPPTAPSSVTAPASSSSRTVNGPPRPMPNWNAAPSALGR